MAPDGQTEERKGGRKDGRTGGQTYIPPPSAGDKNGPIKKKGTDRVLNLVLPGESRLFYHDAMMPLVLQGSTIVSYTYHHYISTLRHLFVLYYVIMS